MVQDIPRIVNINSGQFDVQLDDGRSATVKIIPNKAELSVTCSLSENIMTMSFIYSAFEMEIGHYEDVQFNRNEFMEMLGCGTGTEH